MRPLRLFLGALQGHLDDLLLLEQVRDFLLYGSPYRAYSEAMQWPDGTSTPRPARREPRCGQAGA
ncbi:hypothetical protein [Streptosporangium canum]|uniref:hypothetical protein n=1 Tax=Streptosporangium canum TaxID=324952 RepID=UPI0037A8431F